MSAERFSVASLMALLLVVACGAGPEAGWREAVHAVPPGWAWTSVPQAQQAALAELVRAAPEELERLLASEDPIDRGLGIFILEQRGDLRALIEHSNLLLDERPTVPLAAISAVSGHYPSSPQTVSDYMRRAYYVWFGIFVLVPADVDRLLGDVPDFSTLAQPWRVRLQRAAAGGPASVALGVSDAQVKAQVRNLEPELRWLVVMLGRADGLYTDQEAIALIGELPQEIIESAVRGSIRPGIAIGLPAAGRAGTRAVERAADMGCGVLA